MGGGGELFVLMPKKSSLPPIHGIGSSSDVSRRVANMYGWGLELMPFGRTPVGRAMTISCGEGVSKPQSNTSR